MTRSKIRIAAALAAALAVAIVPAASQAAVKPSKITDPAPIVETTTNMALQTGSAGIPGYSDQRCESLLDDALTAADVTVQEYDAGTPNSSRAKQASEIGKKAWDELKDNCLVVY
jgi:hypothetical protein